MSNAIYLVMQSLAYGHKVIRVIRNIAQCWTREIKPKTYENNNHTITKQSTKWTKAALTLTQVQVQVPVHRL